MNVMFVQAEELHSTRTQIVELYSRGLELDELVHQQVGNINVTVYP